MFIVVDPDSIWRYNPPPPPPTHVKDWIVKKTNIILKHTKDYLHGSLSIWVNALSNALYGKIVLD